MIALKATPGPWKAEPMVPNAANAFYITATPDGNNSEKDVATVGPCLAKTTAANANLIAAAPELYEALKQASLMCSLYAQFIRNHVKADDLELHPYLPELEQVEEDADAVLRKARGEQ